MTVSIWPAFSTNTGARLARAQMLPNRFLASVAVICMAVSSGLAILAKGLSWLQALHKSKCLFSCSLRPPRKIVESQKSNVCVTIGMPIKVEEYLREDASSPYKTWFDSLPAQAAAKVAVAKLRMALGNTSSIKWFDGMGEYIIDWGPGYRIYLAKEGDTLIILFGGGTKRGQQRDIDKAKVLLAEYKARKKQKR
jgi:putative addiction module killer protein